MAVPFTFQLYSEQAQRTALYDKSKGIEYCALGLASEAGEVAGVVKRHFRGDHPALNKEAVVAEIGDVLWYCSQLAREVGSDLETAALRNIEKLAKRQAAGTIRGAGDNR